MLTKEQLLKRLRDDPMYLSALKMAKTDSDRRRIIATAEGFLGSFFDAMSPITGRIANDPKMSADLKEAVNSGKRVVRESDGKPVDDSDKRE